MSLTGFIDRVTGKSTVSTKPADLTPASEKAAAPLVPVTVSAPEADAGAAAAFALFTVTVAPGKSIGKGRNAKGPGETLDVTRAEAIRLRAQGFIV